MYVQGTSDKKTVYATYTDANGRLRIRVCTPNEAAFAVTGGLVIGGYDSVLTALGAEAGYSFGKDNPVPTVQATIGADALQDALAEAVKGLPQSGITKEQLDAALKSITLKAS